MFVLAAFAAGSSAQQTPSGAAAAAAQPARADPRQRRQPQPAQPATTADRQRPSFRAGIDIVSLNVTVTDGVEPLRHRPRPERLLGLRGRRQAGHHLLHAAAAADRAVAAARQQRQHGETSCRRCRRRPTNFVKRLKPNDIAQVIDFDSRVEIRRRSPATRPSSRPPSSRPTPAARRRCTTRSTSR